VYVGSVVGNSIQVFDTSGSGSIFALVPSYASGMAFDTFNNLYITDGDRNSIYRYGIDGSQTLFASTFPVPRAIVFNGMGGFYVTTGGSLIEKISADGSGSQFAQFDSVQAVLALDKQGNLYVAAGEPGGFETIKKITPTGIASDFASGFTGGILGLAFDGIGNLFVAQNAERAIDKITLDGTVSVFAQTSFSLPGAIAIDSLDNLYVTSTAGNKIEKFTPDGTGSDFASLLNGGPSTSIVIASVPEPSPRMLWLFIAVFMALRRFCFYCNAKPQ